MQEVRDHFGAIEGAHPVWIARGDRSRNRFVLFRRRFVLEQVPDSAVLKLFADTRYRMRVNGVFVAAGPARFVTQHPEFDTVDLAPQLREGDNVVEVEVNFYGASSFQTMPDGRPGFIASGTAGAHDLSTPGGWEASACPAWDAAASLYSFAQGPVEVLDTRQLPPEEFTAPIELQGEDAPWGPLTPRTAPVPDYAPRTPDRLLLTAPVATGEHIYGIQENAAVLQDQFIKGHGRLPMTAFATWLHSPRAQKVKLGLFWGEFALNGEPFKMKPDQTRGNRGEATVELREGWNLLSGRFEQLTETWSFLLGIPKGRGISVKAAPDFEENAVFAVLPPRDREQIDLSWATGPEALPPADWEKRSGSIRQVSPARLVAWDQPGESAVRHVAMEKAEKALRTDRDTLWNFQFDFEYLGFVEIDIEAPAGTILDVAYDEWLRSDDCVDLYRTNPFFDATDRYILKGGRQRIQGYHSRGGTLLQLTARYPRHATGEVRIHSIRVLETRTLKDCEGHFASGDELLDWAWQASVNTLMASTEDAYSDSPWRERGSYIGDCLANLHLHFLCGSDLRASRRVLKVFAQAALPNGQLACCAPAWLRKPHEDFTLHWIQSVYDYWARTGDASLVEEVWPAIEDIWNSSSWSTGKSGLWDTTGMRVFIDWGVTPSEREGDANGVVNVLRVAALRFSARLAEVLGKTDRSRALSNEADAVEAKLFEVLWVKDEGRFAASVEADGRFASTSGLHANVLALYHRIGSEEQRASMLAYLEPHLKANLANGLREGQFSGHLELFFLFFTLEALARHNRIELAVDLLREHYGYLKQHMGPTLPECFCRVEQGVGSRCHSWSGAAAVFATQHLAGLQLAEPGNPDRYVVRPSASGPAKVSLTVPHAKGPLTVEVSRNGSGHPSVSVQAPEGVTVEAAN